MLNSIITVSEVESTG
nr:hypothetical protein [Salmonella enterica]